ncbi:ribosomal protein S18-alanine N-acetyltransferase [Paenibacillus thermoaerophilus]|uniref:Ribosomal protein S18-alanine N-acetyltransferase n=1 Tax=Paenibacillus thermoaerophilus TaxID=1215385 RepID=A0ABW2V497_9BACL|nr:ribosomal protein S18-alanine N-acetyltransferase [Paenibacillus thermoaerophilus]TMV11063.1 ribosomal-protein-alanine N-acetyltransferase [Paenibacillus thermoaerophilus]
MYPAPSPQPGGSTDGQSYSFRPMRLEDIPTICEIEIESFATPWSEAAFYNELVNNHFAHYIVLQEDGTGSIVGYGGMWIVMDEAHVTNVAIRSPWRGRKLGEKLMRKLQTTAVSRGAERMTLEVRVSNTVAQNLYRKLGFVPSGIRPQYYSDNNEDALMMWATLRERAEDLE